MKSLDAYRMPLSGTQLVEASAGTGKTYTIGVLFLRLLLERKLAVSEILVVTYTRAATAELRDRIRSRLQQALALCQGDPPTADEDLAAYLRSREHDRQADQSRLALAVSGFDEASIFTIHGFCQRALADVALESRAAFDVEFIEDERPLLREITQDFWTQTTFETPLPRLRALLAQKVNLSVLEPLAEKTGDEHVPVLPQEVQEPPPPDATRFEHAKKGVVSLWRAHRGEVQALLQGGQLSRTSYKPKTFEELWSLLDALPQAHARDIKHDDLRKLTPAELADKTKKHSVPPVHPLFDACQELLEACQEQDAYGRALSLYVRRRFVDYVRAERRQRKQAAGVQGFDDLLSQLAEGLRSGQRAALLQQLRKSYGAALIDEFQDTDPLQYEVFSDVFSASECPLLLIGDPKQAIYGFRGADIFAYLAAAQAAGEKRHTLAINYRSDPGLVDGINQIFAGAAAPFLFESIGFHPVTARPGITDALSGPDAPLQFLANDRDAATISASVATEIVDLLLGPERIDGRALLPRDIAVLCRTNKQARDVHGALSERGVPCVLEGDSSVFDLPLSEELQRVLTAMAFPDEPQRVRAALATSLCGVTSSDLLALDDDDARWEQWATRFLDLHRTWLELGFVQAFQRMVDQLGVARQLLSRRDGERRLTDLLHLGELLHGAATRLHLGPLSLLQWLADVRSDETVRAGVPESAQIRLESDAHVVRVTTVHKSKGLEYPIVYCPFSWGDAGLFTEESKTPRFHDAADADRLKLDLGSDDQDAHRERASAESLSEGLRLLYVALTRAKHRTYLVWHHGRSPEKVPLLYLLTGGGGEVAAAQLKGRKADQTYATLVERVERAGAAIGLRALRAPEMRRYPTTTTARILTARTCAAPALGVTLQSFSALSGVKRKSSAAHALDLDVDHDVGTEIAERESAPAALRIPLFDFPGGARMGTLIHHVFEHLDFAADEPQVLAQVTRSLSEFSEPLELAPPLARSVRDCLATVLDDAELRLNRISRCDRLDEMEFMLKAGAPAAPFLIGRLAEVMAAAPSPLLQKYAKELALLPAESFFGFLRGFIDLVFRHDGRYYLVDYKSNLLGLTFADYAASSMERAMVEKHYVLQYHLYTVALDHYLRVRLRGYDYERDFGGVYYLFLRGMAEGAPVGSGVFYDRPAPELVARLSNVIAGEGT